MKANIMWITVLVVLFLACCIRASTRIEKEQKILESILDQNTYKPSILPASNGSGPVLVRINTFVRSIGKLDDINMEYPVQLTFRQSWKDERLSYQRHPEVNSKIKYVTVKNPASLWTPDTFFSNEKTGHFHNLLEPNVLLRIYPDGKVLYSIRISLQLKCPMDLKYYPMDRQVCSIILASYAYTTEDVVYVWKDEDPVQVTRNLHLSRFTLEKFSTDYCTSKANTGEFSCLKIDLLFKREFRHYFHEIFMPSIILVMISWICFWLDQRATAARVFIWMTVFLTFSVKLAFFRSEVPDTNYNTVYDTWTTTCLLFLVAVICEIGLIAFLLSREERKDTSDNTSGENDCIKEHNFGEDAPQQQSNAITRVYRILLRRYPSPEQKIDVLCRILFPLAFGLFNLFYWSCTTKHYD